jgi:copper chaperone CopZ
VQSALSSVSGVESVTVDFATKTATVTGSDIDAEALAACFADTKFAATVKD